MKKKSVIVYFTLIIVLPFIESCEIQNYEITGEIYENATFRERIKWRLNNTFVREGQIIQYILPKTFSIIHIKQDHKDIPYNISYSKEKNILLMLIEEKEGLTEIKLDIMTENVVKKNKHNLEFAMTLDFQCNIETFLMTLIVPNNYHIPEFNQNYADSALVNQEIMWPPGNIISDGKQFQVKWEAFNIEGPKKSTFQLVLEPMKSENHIYSIIVLILSLIIVYTSFLIGTKYSLQKKENKDHIGKKEKKTYFTDYEEQIVSILRESNGETSQHIICEKLDVSKAKVSYVIGDLEKKGVITKEAAGRTNLIKLR